MKKEIYKFLEDYSYDPLYINRLIVSTFIYSQKKELDIAKNKLLKIYLIKEGEKDYKDLQNFRKICQLTSIEELIQIFEFIISPEEKVVTGAVYTPIYIRDYIVEECFSKIKDFSSLKVCDPACGCAGFLYTAAKIIKAKTSHTYYEIFSKNIFGLDIQDYSITRSKILLTLFAFTEGEANVEFKFNLFHGNALDFKWSSKINNYKGFQVIVGNPPYVCSRNMDEDSFNLLDNWSVTKSGHPDLYIPFFQIGYENLIEGGELGLITVNTFIKSINGRALRGYFSQNKIEIKIINFGGEQIFKNRNTYTCLCFLRKAKGAISYRRIPSSALLNFDQKTFFSYSYADLNNQDGWNLVDNNDTYDFIGRIEATGKPFQELFTTRNGIATLRNDIYKFIPTDEDKKFFHITKFGKEYKIEKGICRRIVNANKIKTEKDLLKKTEQIIFPYYQKGDEILIFSEEIFMQKYPFAYSYLKSLKKDLSLRDKGKTKYYEKWYSFGRRQSLDIYAYKLFFPHICERPTFVISKEKDLLFYNGIAVISDSLSEIQELKSLLESDIFFEYIKNTTKDYSSGYISLSRNYIKKFGILELTNEEKLELKEVGTNSNTFWEKMYKKAYKNSKPS